MNLESVCKWTNESNKSFAKCYYPENREVP